ncbi:MAG: hypothetical protein US25_C0032G0008 [Candidatus Moranbacteria bacterium GW2011_GWE1_36_7]|nr:MAG: hypothetical protein UR99_C0022G0010 [Candidatus Moranbacteria bacterium GW2011_GWD2_36_12]KKQ06315.1 MAG: hypothetical protein US16_C0019G0011 [Candidatus Moranbacteria bacterium GW2011_GWE2_36_40]KKQ13975.1 MAG: hypothetical protein US25_C0032G0008 [Candidatus Moranbacteria bacterium GW2011_GWE1_36_7]
MENKHEILLGLTTTPSSDWRGKVEEMKKFGIKKIALFPTFLKIEERKELYKLLEDIEDLEIPHVHLRNDMDSNEIEYFKNRFKSQVFNIHPANNKYSFSDDFLKYSSQTYVENLIMIPTDEELRKYAGLCIDFSHWENNVRLNNNDWNNSSAKYNDVMIDRLKGYLVGCCHVSAVLNEVRTGTDFPEGRQYDSHTFNELDELDYIGQYRQYLPYYISLELENSFEEQLKAKQYLEGIINN